MRYVFYCQQDGKFLTKHPYFRKFKQGQFIGYKHNKDGEPTEQIPVNDIDKAEVYNDYDYLVDLGGDFAMADMFWAVELKNSGPPDTALWLISGDITKNHKNVVVKIDFTLFHNVSEEKK